MWLGLCAEPANLKPFLHDSINNAFRPRAEFPRLGNFGYSLKLHNDVAQPHSVRRVIADALERGPLHLPSDPPLNFEGRFFLQFFFFF
jgi:hypothetical protein